VHEFWLAFEHFGKGKWQQNLIGLKFNAVIIIAVICNTPFSADSDSYDAYASKL
jgi:hypothetical protein